MTTVIAPSRPPRQANLVAEHLTGRPYVSFSQIGVMRSCPKKLELHYIQQATPDFTPASLIFGSAIHAATEDLCRASMAGVALSASDLHQTYRVVWADRPSGLPVRYAKDQNESKLDEMARRMLEVFITSPAAAIAGTIVGVEEEFTVAISPDLPDVLARVDLVYETESHVVVRDLKTARSKWTPEKAEESADQLMLYGRMLQELSRGIGKPARGEFVVLTKQKTPQVQVLDVPITSAGIQRTCDAIHTTWQAILSGNFYAAPSPMNCSTCQYKSKCPVFSGK